jgi:predicted  nucleic acid-binding Zn-ribbon protein
MTERTRSALKKLQALDVRIAEMRQKVRDFDPLFEEVEEPALVLQSELENTRKRLKEMKVEERRVELATEEKQARLEKLEERQKNVRNLREEAAVSAELDMVKRSLQSEEQEAYTLIDQIRKLSEREEELEQAFKEADAQVEPKRQELLDQRQAIRDELEGLRKEREEFAESIDSKELRLYEGIRGDDGRRAVAALTRDGACGNCYGMVPLQIQNEIRHGDDLIRCEQCGVILAAPEPEPSEEEESEEPATAE